MASFFAYRIFLHLTTTQQTLFAKTKEEALKNLYLHVRDVVKIEFNDWGTEHILFHYREITPQIFVWQFSRRQDFTKHVPTSQRIEDQSDRQYPFIFVICHTELQIALVERNTSVFQDLDIAKSKLERFFSSRLDGIAVSLNEISEQREFWRLVNEMDQIEQIDFEYKPPNFFKGSNSVDKLVKDVHEETNFETFKITLKNKIRGLKLAYETFGDHIKRLSSGAGKYIIDGVKDGFPKRIASFIIPFKTEIDVDNVTPTEIENKMRDIDTLNETDDGKKEDADR